MTTPASRTARSQSGDFVDMLVFPDPSVDKHELARYNRSLLKNLLLPNKRKPTGSKKKTIEARKHFGFHFLRRLPCKGTHPDKRELGEMKTRPRIPGLDPVVFGGELV